MRSRHFLPSNHNTELPSRMIWVDTEAHRGNIVDGNEHQSLWFGCAIYRRYGGKNRDEVVARDHLEFTTALEFWTWASEKAAAKTKVWVMAHNWNYDAAILNTSELLPALGWECKSYINGRPPLIVSWKKDQCSMVMVDTLNYFSASLADIGSSLGIEKLEMPSSVTSLDEWKAYCWRDVEVLMHAFLGLRSFIRDEDLGCMQKTLASQSMNAYRHRFMQTKILVHKDKVILLLERNSYRGGRSEAFWYGPTDEHLYKVDINSMYPYIMANHSFSNSLVAYFPSGGHRYWDHISDNQNRVATCLVNTPEPYYGVRHNGRLIFPTGEFFAVLTEPEIRYAERCKHLREVGDWAVYDTAPLFGDFVDFFYKKRQEYRAEGNEVYSFMCKIILNSLYGKFGQTGKVWKQTALYHWESPEAGIFIDAESGEEIYLRNRLGLTEMMCKEEEARDSCPIIASEVTAYARDYLWELILIAGIENVRYVDTDSLILTASGYNNLSHKMDSGLLGALKLEGESDYSEFWTPKDYVFGDEIHIKGIRRTAEKIDARTYKQEMFRSWDWQLKQGSDGYVTVSPVVKHLERVNHKAVVDGYGATKPLRLDLEMG